MSSAPHHASAIRPVAMASVRRCDDDNLAASGNRGLGCVLQGINGEPAEQLGEEVGGFLRQHFAAEGDIADLFHACRVQQESCVGAIANRIDGFLGLSHILQMLLIADVFLRHAEDFCQDKFMKLNDVEGALLFRLPGERLRLLIGSSTQQESRIRGDRQDGCATAALATVTGPRFSMSKYFLSLASVAPVSNPSRPKTTR